MGVADIRDLAAVRRSLRRGAFTAAAFALLLLATPAARAHEIGTTQVHAIFSRDHSFQIDVITSPQTLLNRLEISAHQPRSQGLPPALSSRRIAALAPLFLRACAIEFSGAPAVDTRVKVVPGESSVTMRITGKTPPRAEAFRWRYALSSSSYALTLQNGNAPAVTEWLEGDQVSAPLMLSREVVPPHWYELFGQYLTLGFTHILPHGLDHILFILGLFLLTPRMGALLRQVTAFTIAHSITLALTLYGVLSVSPRIVEPLIALSIAYVAVENLATSELKSWRIAIVFAFGLLHGMGFAGVLRDLGLPRSEFLNALVAFNIGVEAGQLTVIAIATLAFAHWWSARPWYRYRLVVPASAAIACAGIFWTVQRTLAM